MNFVSKFIENLSLSEENIQNPYEMLGILRKKGYSDGEIAYKMYNFSKKSVENQINIDSFSNILAKMLGKSIVKTLTIPFKL